MTTPAVIAEFVAAARRDLAQPEAGEIADADLAKAMTATVRLYAARVEARDKFPPLIDTDEATATDVAVVASELIRAVDMNSFDLSMWYGRPRKEG
jgi:hypothetical protein